MSITDAQLRALRRVARDDGPMRIPGESVALISLLRMGAIARYRVPFGFMTGPARPHQFQLTDSGRALLAAAGPATSATSKETT